MNPRLSVVMPVYNEAGTIRQIVERVLAVPVPKELIVVDDGSTDGTAEALGRLQGEQPDRIRVIRHERNRGKGAAIRTALPHVRGEVVLIQDADLEYNPAEYPKLIEPILAGDADVVYGSRFLGGPHRVLYFWHRLGNGLLTLLTNLCADLNLSDMETGYKVFRAEILKSIPLRSDRFGFEPEVTLKAAKLQCRIYEVPISYRGRDYAEGKKITWRDGARAVLTILRFSIWNDLK